MRTMTTFSTSSIVHHCTFILLTTVCVESYSRLAKLHVHVHDIHVHDIHVHVHDIHVHVQVHIVYVSSFMMNCLFKISNPQFTI